MIALSCVGGMTCVRAQPLEAFLAVAGPGSCYVPNIHDVTLNQIVALSYRLCVCFYFRFVHFINFMQCFFLINVLLTLTRVENKFFQIKSNQPMW